LLKAAEEAGFDVLLTTDKNLRNQQTCEAEHSRLWFSATADGA
jgi:hypothetical protein